MKIFFATPSYGGLKCKPMLDAFEATYQLFKDRGHQVLWGARFGNCYIQAARNQLLDSFLHETVCDKLFWLDDDVVWKPEDALRIAEMQDDIAGATYPLKQDEEGYPVVVFTDANHRPITRPDGCIDASHIPTGFMCVTRSAIEKMCAAYPNQEYAEQIDGELVPGFFDLHPQGVHNGRWWGEDTAFCRLWRDIGGKIWLVPDVDLEHHGKDKVYRGNYHHFLLRQPGGSKA